MFRVSSFVMIIFMLVNNLGRTYGNVSFVFVVVKTISFIKKRYL